MLPSLFTADVGSLRCFQPSPVQRREIIITVSAVRATSSSNLNTIFVDDFRRYTRQSAHRIEICNARSQRLFPVQLVLIISVDTEIQ